MYVTLLFSSELSWSQAAAAIYWYRIQFYWCASINNKTLSLLSYVFSKILHGSHLHTSTVPFLGK